MAHLTMNELSGLGAHRFLKLSRGRAGIVSRQASGGGLSGLGQASECGPSPSLAPGEQTVCCPNTGWVIYDSGESGYGICERAQAQSGGGTSTGTSTAPLPDDPVARVEEMRRRLDDRRMAREEEAFEQQKSELQLRFVMGQMQAVQRQEAARIASEQAREDARMRAEAKRREEKDRQERNKKLLIGAGVAFVGAKILGYL